MQLEFLADRSIPEPSVREIRALGNLVEIAADDDRETVAETARREDQVLLTTDLAFHDVVFEEGVARPPGVVCFRFEWDTPRDPANLLAALIADDDIDLLDNFTLLDRQSVRQKPLDPAGK